MCITEMQICPTYISKINLDYEKTNNSLSDPKQRKIRLALPFTNNKKKNLLYWKKWSQKRMVILIVCIAFILWEKEISFFLYKNKDFCGIVLPSQEDLILKFNQYMKSDKMPCIIYADLESLMKKIDGYANSGRKVFINKNRWTYSVQIFSVIYMDI